MSALIGGDGVMLFACGSEKLGIKKISTTGVE